MREHGGSGTDMTTAVGKHHVAARYLNFYRCTRCATEWEDARDATCDDECPRCGTIMTPHASDDEFQ